MKTDTTLHLTRTQYRQFAELSKTAGMALNLSSYTQLNKAWGRYTFWALLVCRDATDPQTLWAELGMMEIAQAINSAQFRACGRSRPELDWAALEDHEIYPFVLQHEIGHKVSNFSTLEIMMLKDITVRDECHCRVRFVNEILADRYAWACIRPGEPVPVSENGKRLQDKAADSQAYLELHAPKMNPHRIRALEPGQYHDVPEKMLRTPKRAGFLGPAVSKALIERCATRHPSK